MTMHAAGVATRFHPRVEAGFMVKLFLNGKEQMVRADNLSMAGLKLLGEFSLQTTQLKISIPLPGDREIKTQAQVRRHHIDSIAVEFDDLDWDDMLAMSRFLHPRLP